MKSARQQSSHRGFTLMELMVAMAITTVMVAVLVNITNSAVDTWSRGRTELRSARQAKAMVDVMANDFESMVSRSGNKDEWLAAVAKLPAGSDAPSVGGTNATTLVFFTAATDRYDGQIGRAQDNGGDISCVGYQLSWKDPIDSLGGGEPLGTYVLNRHLVNPDDTFNNLLGKATDGVKLDGVFMSSYSSQLNQASSYICENIFQFTVTFHVEVQEDDGEGNITTKNKLVSMMEDGGNSDSVWEFRVRGTGIVTEPTKESLATGTLTAVEVSLTVMSEAGITALRNDTQPKEEEKYDKWLQKNTFHYSRLIQLPRM